MGIDWSSLTPKQQEVFCSKSKTVKEKFKYFKSQGGDFSDLTLYALCKELEKHGIKKETIWNSLTSKQQEVFYSENKTIQEKLEYFKSQGEKFSKVNYNSLSAAMSLRGVGNQTKWTGTSNRVQDILRDEKTTVKGKLHCLRRSEEGFDNLKEGTFRMMLNRYGFKSRNVKSGRPNQTTIK